jgi:hypothetical protein
VENLRDPDPVSPPDISLFVLNTTDPTSETCPLFTVSPFEIAIPPEDERRAADWLATDTEPEGPATAAPDTRYASPVTPTDADDDIPAMFEARSIA